ncbi:DUF2927 domain-containing protein [Rhodobacter sp. KR11]|uniref:DUF2927 domain-containing protein n=1 Tax=Rhodobacter sp. KR11 TaxID=2974588 RepID=UPI002222EC66|nr:DUF2927 domain-containing protein [Rhodobacter sp. KR11]MCW1918349.1 DUF2927 domain-containing protein [Rhodobacter sp. KR11]
MTPDTITQAFTHPAGFRFARWGRPIVPVVFGVEDATLAVVKGAIEAVVTLAGHKMAETDPELGANLMVFFFRDWTELPQVPNLDRLVPDLAPLCARLAAEGAHHYRLFRFDDQGAIRACFTFLCMGGALADLPAEDLALSEAARMILLWGPDAPAFLARTAGVTVLSPDVAALIRAAYDPILPTFSPDPIQALRLAARISLRA